MNAECGDYIVTMHKDGPHTYEYVPSASPAEYPEPTYDPFAAQRMAAQNQFLLEHLDLICPWRFTLPQHVIRRQGRLMRSWGETAVRLRNEGKRP